MAIERYSQIKKECKYDMAFNFPMGSTHIKIQNCIFIQSLGLIKYIYIFSPHPNN